MTLSSPFARRIAGVFTTRVARFLLGFVTSFLLARILGPAGRGVYALTSLAPTTLATLGQLGLPQAFSFFAGRGRSGRRLQLLAIGLSIALTVVLGAAIVLALPWLESTVLRAAPGDLVRLSLLSIPFQFLTAFAGAVLIGRQTLRNYNILLIAQSVALLLLMVLLVGVLQQGVWGAVVANLAITIATAAAMALELRRSTRHEPPATDDRGVRIGELFGFGLRIYPASVAGFFGYRADVFLLSAIVGDPRTLGLYSLAVSLGELLFFVPDSVSTVFFPRVAGSERQAADQLTPMVSRFTVLITGLSLAALIPAAFVLVLVLLPDYAPSLTAFLVITPGIVALSVAKVLTSYIGGLGMPLRVATASGTSLAVNLVANLALIPFIGFVGAAAASLISYTVQAAMLLNIASRLSRVPVRGFIVPTGAEWQRLVDGVGEILRLLRSRGRMPPPPVED